MLVITFDAQCFNVYEAQSCIILTLKVHVWIVKNFNVYDTQICVNIKQYSTFEHFASEKLQTGDWCCYILCQSVVFFYIEIQAIFGSYNWESYDRINERVINLSSGLLSLSGSRNSTVCILVETRAEWIICLFACFKSNLPGMSFALTDGCEEFMFFTTLVTQYDEW